MKNITLLQASRLTGENANSLYRRIVRSGIVPPKNSHGEIEIPIGLAIPPKLAEMLLTDRGIWLGDAH